MDIVEQLRQWSPEESTYKLHKEAADEIERVRYRVELLDRYLKGALDFVEGFSRYTTEARKALGEKE